MIAIAFDAGVDDSYRGCREIVAMTFAAAPPARRLKTIWRVTSDGYAETFWSAMPWSAPKMMSSQVDMLGWRERLEPGDLRGELFQTAERADGFGFGVEGLLEGRVKSGGHGDAGAWLVRF